MSDIKSINSKVKSWLYADQFEKPEELVLFRPTSLGGLNIHHTKYKALSMLIKSFLETAINPNYLHSTYHTALFNRHVLMDRSWPDPGMPPYFSEEFFSIIRKAHLECSQNLSLMSSRQWYNHLLQDNVTMSNTIPPNPVPCRVEVLNPDNDWGKTWRLSRLKGLNSNQTSFLWRLLHRVLPTLDRVNRITPNTSPICKLCDEKCIEDLPHALINCSFNRNVGMALLDTLSNFQSNLSQSDLLTLNFNVEDQIELPMVWMVSKVLQKIWDIRKEKKKCELVQVRAVLEAKVSLLRETRHKESAGIISQMLSSL